MKHAIIVLLIIVFAILAGTLASKSARQIESWQEAEISSICGLDDVYCEGEPVPTVCEPPEACAMEWRVSAAFREYLGSKNPELAVCAEILAEHPRGLEAIAISGVETSFCTAGVGKSQLNCGGIRSSIPGQAWVSYPTKCEGLHAIATLIETDRYANKTIDEINGVYCIGASGGKCPGWTAGVTQYVNELRALFPDMIVIE